MKVHFIAIGGSAMHNLAIALHKKGYKVTGSDDEIFEPSKGRLDDHGILPEAWGWFPDKISDELDAIILGMHARKDNPELQKALSLGLKVYSYPEYIYSQTINKNRVIIGGSHGKTTVTSMIMHALHYNKVQFDFMVGAQLEGFDTMVNLENETNIAVFEGDEYLSSPIDLRPKFLWYQPNMAVLTGIAWDHINVFPTFEMYVHQFELFIETIPNGGTLVYYQGDEILADLAKKHQDRINLVPYQVLENSTVDGVTFIEYNGKAYAIQVFGTHNLENLNAAMQVCLKLGLDQSKFLASMASFKGAARRLQLLRQEENTTIYFDFAHSPSKLKATTSAVKEQYSKRKLVACMELHTFSSLSKDFLPQYNQAMAKADMAYVYFSPDVIKHKQLSSFNIEDVKEAFGQENLKVFTDSTLLIKELREQNWKDTNLLIMTSGNFNGVDIKKFAAELTI